MTINPIITPTDNLDVIITLNENQYNVLISSGQPFDFNFNLSSAVIYDGDVVTYDGQIVFNF